MSGTILSALPTPLSQNGFGTLDQTRAATQTIEAQIATLSTETSSGYLSTTYAGLGSAAGPALTLSSQIAANTGIAANAATAGNIQQVAQTALGQIEQIASNFASQALSLPGTSSGVQSVASSAQSALVQVAQLLDTKLGDTYVFAGQDSSNPPVPDPDAINQSGFAQAIAAAVGGLATNGAAATSAATLAIGGPGGTTPFSATLEAGPGQSEVDLGGGVRVALAPLANSNSDAVSAGVGTTSTGSYTRDILTGLASLASLGNTDVSDSAFSSFVTNTAQTLNGAVAAVNVDIAGLGARQQQVSTAQTDLASVNTALKTQLDNDQDADLSQVAAQLSQAQTQLQASFQVIANLSQDSLVKYLPT